MDNRENHATFQHQHQLIETPERVSSLMNSAMENHPSVKIAPDHSDESFQTHLLNIDYERKLLTLKQIDYTFGHLMVIAAKSLNVYCQQDGAEISFSTYLSRFSERNGGFYEIRFPEKVQVSSLPTNRFN